MGIKLLGGGWISRQQIKIYPHNSTGKNLRNVISDTIYILIWFNIMN